MGLKEIIKDFFTPIDAERTPSSTITSSTETIPQYPCPMEDCLSATEIIQSGGNWVRVRCPVHQIETYHAKEKKETGPSQVIRPEWSYDIKNIMKDQKK